MITMNPEVYEILTNVSSNLVKLTMCQLNISERRIVDSIRDDIEKVRGTEMSERRMSLSDDEWSRRTVDDFKEMLNNADK